MSRGGNEEGYLGNRVLDDGDIPIALAARVMGSVREADGSPMATLVFVERTGETSQIDLPPGVVLQLMVGLAQFSDQIHQGP